MAIFAGEPLLPDARAEQWARSGARLRGVNALQLWHYAEQFTDPDNRVVLSRQRDELGHRVGDLRFRWSRATTDSLRRGAALVEERLSVSGVGRVTRSDDPGENEPTWGLHHHMGTTRMHSDPAYGVVDADCQVHGTPNLFVAGTSPFPSGGFANPTLTALALALRLGDHLRAR